MRFGKIFHNCHNFGLFFTQSYQKYSAQVKLIVHFRMFTSHFHFHYKEKLQCGLQKNETYTGLKQHELKNELAMSK